MLAIAHVDGKGFRQLQQFVRSLRVERVSSRSFPKMGYRVAEAEVDLENPYLCEGRHGYELYG